MLFIEEYKKEITARTLNNDENVFHKALRAVLKGENRFHINNNELGKFDLVYKDNLTLLDATSQGFRMMPPFYIYDETKQNQLDLSMFDQYDSYLFDEANEYSAVITRILLNFTQKDVYTTDKRILWFVKENKHLHVVDVLPDYKQVNGIYTDTPYGSRIEYQRSGYMQLFLDVFVFEWMADIPFQDIKYVEVGIMARAGIGAMLSQFVKLSEALSKFGIKVIFNTDSSKYSKKLLEKYFAVNSFVNDSNETNTAYIENGVTLSVSHCIKNNSTKLDLSCLSDSFRKELEEYRDAIIGNKKMLGVLIRGTDYITTKMSGIRKMATVEEMIPVIDLWMKEDNYDGIFLATEDLDILNKMREHYGNKVVVIAQERHSVKDFENVTLITELEKKEYSGEEYEQHVEDTTVNYFYALYLLSQCTSIMFSGYCNGYDIVEGFNTKGFMRDYTFSIGVNKQ